MKFKLESKKYSNYDKSYFADSLLLHYRKINPDSALIYARLMYSLVLKDTNQINIQYSLTHLGSLHRILGNLDSSIYYYKIALAGYRKIKYEEGIASIYNNLATVYKTQNRYDLAIKNYLEALDVFKNSKRLIARGNLYSNFAGLYFKLENYDRAKEYWQLAEKDFIKEKSAEITHSYRGYAKIHLENRKPNKAISEINKAFANDSISGIDVFLIEDYLLMLELILVFPGTNGYDIKLFDSYSSKLFTLLHDKNLPLALSKYHDLIGNRHFTYGNIDKAILHYDSALVINKSEAEPEFILEVLRKQFQMKLHKNKVSYLDDDFRILRTYEKKVSELKKARLTQETDARYSLKDKEEKIKLLNEKNKTANDLIESEKELALQSKRQILWMWLGIGLFLGFIIYVLFTNKKLKSTQKELQKNIEQKDFLFRELNHRVKNNLHIVSSFLSIESHGKTEEVKEILLTCENRIHSLGLVHEMLYQGEISENIELSIYFEKLVKVIRETLVNDSTEIKTDIETELKLHSNKIVLLGLIANELITNAIKYAKSPERNLVIRLEIKSSNGKIQMKISDNGIGFNETANKKNSLGMKLAKGLTNQLNGELLIENKNEGVEFKIVF